MAEYRIFKTFTNEPDALAMAERLLELGIVSEIEDQSFWLDSAFGGGDMTREFHLKIPADQFQEAKQLMAIEAELYFDKLPPDYYLFEFTDNELLEVVHKPDEWSELDGAFAKKLLREREVFFDEEEIERTQKARYDQLATERKVPAEMLIRGYLMVFLGGFFGVMIGLRIWRGTRTIPDGRLVYEYNQAGRNHGKLMVIIGLLIIVLIVLIAALGGNLIPRNLRYRLRMF